MNKLKKLYQRTLHEIVIMPRILQIIFAILIIIFIYQMVSLYYIQLDLNKVKLEIEQLNNYPGIPIKKT